MRYLASHENTTRGTSDFPLELYYVDMLHPRYEMPFHWHMECELLLVLQGEFTLLTDGQSYTLHPGIPPFFPPEPYMAESPKTASMNVWYLI